MRASAPKARNQAGKARARMFLIGSPAVLACLVPIPACSSAADATGASFFGRRASAIAVRQGKPVQGCSLMANAACRFYLKAGEVLLMVRV